jgi:hypothetical protein
MHALTLVAGQRSGWREPRPRSCASAAGLPCSVPRLSSGPRGSQSRGALLDKGTGLGAAVESFRGRRAAAVRELVSTPRMPREFSPQRASETGCLHGMRGGLVPGCNAMSGEGPRGRPRIVEASLRAGARQGGCRWQGRACPERRAVRVDRYPELRTPAEASHSAPSLAGWIATQRCRCSFGSPRAMVSWCPFGCSRLPKGPQGAAA